MDRRLPVERPAPGPLEGYLARFDPVLVSRAQRQHIRDYVAALLLPRDRNKTLTALAGAEPGVGAQHRGVQALQWFLTDSPWDHERVNEVRIAALLADPVWAPHAGGVLVVDDSGFRKDGRSTAGAARQWIGSLGQVAPGIVAVTTCWTDARCYHPLHARLYRPADTLPGGKTDPDFAPKPRLAADLVAAASAAGVAFRAVVADAWYGPGNTGLAEELDNASILFVLAMKPNKPVADPGGSATPAQLARIASQRRSGRGSGWVRVVRHYSDGHVQTWWACELAHGRFGPGKAWRLIVATTDTATLPSTSTEYLATNLPRRRRGARIPPAGCKEITSLYGLRNWIEQDYKQVKRELGWADFQVRTARAIERHWVLVNAAATFCWLHGGSAPEHHDQPRGRLTTGPGRETWPARLRRIRAWLTPLRDLQRIIASGALTTIPTPIQRLTASLATGNGINLYLPP